jgi:molecular chaperone DnaK (HSP70)
MSKSLFSRAFSAIGGLFAARPSESDDPPASALPPDPTHLPPGPPAPSAATPVGPLSPPASAPPVSAGPLSPSAPSPAALAGPLSPPAPSPAATPLAPSFPVASPLAPSAERADVETPPKVRLFGDDVAVKHLPLSISIETLGGVSSMLILRGTALPAEQRETFSTAANGQSTIDIHVLVGDREGAADNVTVGKYSIVDIEPAPRGTCHFEVALAVDAEGAFALTARDKRTGKRHPVKVAGVPRAPLGRADVETMLVEARAEEARGPLRVNETPDHLNSVKVGTKKLCDLIQSARTVLKSDPYILVDTRRACEAEIEQAERVLVSNEAPERASVKLDFVKADALYAAIDSLGQAVRRCKRGTA